MRARSARPDVDEALERRDVVVTWLNRGTLHLVRSEDLAWLHALTAPRSVTANATRLRQEGVRDPERSVADLLRLLADGPLPRRRIALPGVPASGLLHVLFLAASRGLIVRGGPSQHYVLTADWLGPQPAVDRDKALAELGRRYLVSRPDADDRDLAKWAGITLTDARTALRAAKPVRQPRNAAQPKLLGAFDEVLMGYADRSWVLGTDEARVVSGGIFRPMILLDGRAAGTWRYVKGRVQLEPFEPIDEASLAGEIEAVEAFLGR